MEHQLCPSDIICLKVAIKLSKLVHFLSSWLRCELSMDSPDWLVSKAGNGEAKVRLAVMHGNLIGCLTTTTSARDYL